ncbi:MAG: hypothetical protein GY926_02430 [bacterium]|nr:hypothetical protein [bacterium]
MAEKENDNGLHAVAITDRVEHTSRRFARMWSVTAVVVFVALAATIGIPHGPDLETWERQAHLFTLALAGVATVIAWRWEGIGGAVLLVAATSLGVLAALQHQPLIAFLPAATFLIPAVAFLIAWHRTKSIASLIVLATAVIMLLFTGSVVAQSLYDYGYGAAHPQSDLSALPESPVAWLWVGGVTDTQASLVARLDDAAESKAVATDSTGQTHEVAGTDDEGIWHFELTNLTPATDYGYHLVVDGVARPERTGSFHTFSTEPTSFRVAIGSCARLASNGTVYEAILETDPDLFLVPGDFYYADHMETPAQFAKSFDTTLTQPAQAALLGAVPIAYVWDDHDFGGNNSDSTAATRQIAREAYDRFVPHYPLESNGSIHQAFTIGRVRFLMLDGRYERDPGADADSPEKTMLGQEQLAWLQEQLLESADTAVLTVIVSSVPWIADPEAGADHWGGYTYERQQIADFIASSNLGNIVMVAGDAHMVAIDDGTNTDYSVAGNATFPLLHAAALDRPGSTKGGPYSEGAFPGGGQFGLIDVEDDGSSELTVRLQGMDWTGQTITSHTFTAAAP